MGRFLYNLFLPVYLLVSLPGLLMKMRRRGGYGAHFWQRFGCYDRETRAKLEKENRPWWLHAVSVGEVLIALKLIERIQQRLPEQRLILSTTSSTGYTTARDKAPDGVQVIYNPLDLPGIVQRVLTRLRPQLIVLMESELWPNLIASAAKRGIPVLISNARLSPRSGRRYARFRALASPTLNRLTAVLTQEATDAERWAATGLASDKIHCLGSIKFDPAAHQTPGEDQLGKLRPILESAWGDMEGIYAVLLGSSHAGEELAVAQVYAKLRADHPQLRLILVPRHFERGAEIMAELEPLGFPVMRRSCWPEWKSKSDASILLVDSTGELGAWYALADAVIIGKSFLGEGGQNPVEPIMVGRPVVVGPHMENFAALTELLLREGGISQVEDARSLGPLLASWLSNSSITESLAASGRRALELHAGATDRTVEKLLAISSESA